MKTVFILILACFTLLTGCNLQGPEERAISEMMRSFLAGVSRDDSDLAEACLLNLQGFNILNPDASARRDAEGYTAEVLDELRSNYRDLVSKLNGKNLKLKKLILGNIWYQYKGHTAFKDTQIIVDADSEEITITIRGLVKIGDSWRIVDLSGIELY